MNSVTENSVVERCDSTNDLARRLGESGCPHGTWISARVQDKGRGRLGREWQSIEGNLFLSIVVRPSVTDKSLLTWVPLATAVGIATVLRESFSDLSVKVKWPNDLQSNQKKLGGILCEAVWSKAESFVVIGIGLNCTVAPEKLDQPTTSLSQEAHRLISADDIRMKVIQGVLSWMELDREKISASYTRLAAFPPGSLIQWADGARTGVVLGLGPSGELRVHESKELGDEEVSLYAEDVKIRAFR